MQDEQRFWDSSVQLGHPPATYTIEEVYERFFKKMKQDLNIE